jgi:hypothetical protein
VSFGGTQGTHRRVWRWCQEPTASSARAGGGSLLATTIFARKRRLLPFENQILNSLHEHLFLCDCINIALKNHDLTRISKNVRA